MSRTVWRAVASVVAVLLVQTGAVHGQAVGMTVRGVVLGADNAALNDQRVVLHRVQGGEGATIAEAQTGEDGRFDLSAPASADTSAIYFVATRYDGELYIGPAFRGEQTMVEQIIQVGVPGTSASAMMGDAGVTVQPVGRAVTPQNWLLLIIPLVGVAGVALYMLVPRSRIPGERALLIRVAELDERMTTAPPGQREHLLEERGRLMTELRGG